MPQNVPGLIQLMGGDHQCVAKLNKMFVVIAQGNSPKNVHVWSATLNGKPLNRIGFTHAELTCSGELIMKMGPNPQ